MRRRVATAAVVLSLVSSAVRADYRQAYVDALRAEREGRFTQAAALLVSAVAEHPDEALRARLVGAIPEPYLPFHHLGQVYYALHRCRESLAAFERSRRQGVAGQLPEIAAVAAAHGGDCALLVDVEDRLRAAQDRLAKVAAEDSSPGAAQQAKALLEQAGEELEAARGGWDFRRASSALEAVRSAETLLASPAVVEQGVEPPAPVVTPPAGPPEPEPQPPPAAPPLAAAAPVELPPSVRAAAEAYLRGSYATAVDLLDAQIGHGALAEPARFLSHLVRGAATLALYELGGAADSSLRARAAEDVVAARRLRARFHPTTTYFPPGFVAFYEAGGR